jgi:dTDP-4-amino-4,6-dideoxygalactose transaminase
MNIPLVDLKANYHSIKKDIDQAIQDVLESSSFIMGPYVKKFEDDFARFCQVKHGIGCANGTAALHLALLAAGIKKGDEVLTVPNTFIATTECISYIGGKIKFADVSSQTALVDIDALEKAITKKTKALIVVDLYGQMPDMQRIREIAVKHDLFVIEDAAQAHGAEWKGHQPGYYGDIACFSFFPAKNLGCYGDGGAILTNYDELAETLRLLVNHGRMTKYEHRMEGYNYRLDALQAAILDVKLTHLSKWTELRRQHAQFYDRNLPSSVGKILEAKGARHVYYMYVIRAQQRDKLIEYLRQKGIQCGIHYPIPLHLQLAYASYGFRKGQFPVSEQLASQIVSIPMFPELTVQQRQYVVTHIKKFINESSL